jgi:translocation and assembly module TamB
VALQGTTARIERFVARGGKGTLRIDGGAEFGETPTARLVLVADQLQALGRVDRRVVASGRAEVRLDAAALAVNGRFTVDEGLVDLTGGDAPKLSSDVVVIRSARDAAPRQVAVAKPAPRRDVFLDVRVDLGRDLKVRGRGINTELAGVLQLTAPQGILAVRGDVRTVQGKYAAYGQQMDIQRGVISFVGAVENPRLDIRAIRPDLEVQVGVAISGTAQNPRVRLFSSPELSELDKLSWLTLGRASAGLAGDQTALLQRAALALWAGDKGGTENNIAKTFGLTDIGVRRGESGGLGDTIVTLGKQISSRWYVGYERSIEGTGGSWQLIYKVAQRFTLRAQTGDANAIDAIWNWRWD